MFEFVKLAHYSYYNYHTLYSPFKRIVELIPSKFEQSSEISIGTIISLKIQEQAKASGNEESASIIEGLSKESIEWILKIGSGSYRVIGSDDGGTGIATNYFISLFPRIS